MKFATAAVAAALVASASAGDYSEAEVPYPTTQAQDATLTTSQATHNLSYTTQVVTAFTTYCPEATSFAHGGTTYTVTEATTLTITNCPCTVTKPVTSRPFSGPGPVITSQAEHNHTTTKKHPSSGFSTHLPSGTGPFKNGSSTALPAKTSAAASASHTGTASATKSTAPFATGAADRNIASSGFGLAAVLGFVAYFL